MGESIQTPHSVRLGGVLTPAPVVRAVAGDVLRLLGEPAEALTSGCAGLTERIHPDDRDVAAELFDPRTPPAAAMSQARRRRSSPTTSPTLASRTAQRRSFRRKARLNRGKRR